MTTVTVTGNGVYVIPDQKLQELLRWLAANQGSQLQEVLIKPKDYNGRDLLQG
jgi:hypothetical protein